MSQEVDEALLKVKGRIEEELPATWGYLLIAVRDYNLGGHSDIGCDTNMMRQDAIRLLRDLANTLEEQ